MPNFWDCVKNKEIKEEMEKLKRELGEEDVCWDGYTEGLEWASDEDVKKAGALLINEGENDNEHNKVCQETEDD